MIPNEEGWHYLVVKTIALLRGITSKNNGDFYCLNGLHSFRTKNKFKSYKKVCESKKVRNIVMPFEETKILDFNQYQKYYEAPSIVCADLECLIEKTNVKIILKIHQH